MSDIKDDDSTLRATHGVHVQPDPIPNDHPSAHDLLIAEVGRRKAFGIAKYGTTLQPFNGRDPLKDALDEAIDLCVYLVTAIEERDAKPETEEWATWQEVPDGVRYKSALQGLMDVWKNRNGVRYWVTIAAAEHRSNVNGMNDLAPFVRADS